MLPVTQMAAADRHPDFAGVRNIRARVEVPDKDVARLQSFTILNGALPALEAGDQIYVSSGRAGVYRMVMRVEPIAGGAVMIWLSPLLFGRPSPAS